MCNLNDDCIFCRIIKQIIPCYSIYEDSHFLAFLDINPIDNAHTILIPKYHVQNFLDLPEEYLDKLGGVSARITQKLFATTDAIGMNVLSNIGSSAGQVIMHAHTHFIPRYKSDEPINWTSETGDLEKLAKLFEQIHKS